MVLVFKWDRNGQCKCRQCACLFKWCSYMVYCDNKGTHRSKL